MQMKTRALTGCVALGMLLSGGCSSNQFKASENRDVRVIGYSHYVDLKPSRNYREREMPYDPLRHRGDGKSSLDGYAVLIPLAGPAAFIVAGAVVTVVGVNAIGRGITESSRTDTLNKQPASNFLQTRVRSALQSGLARQRYSVVALTGVKNEVIHSDQPLPLGNTLPSLADEQIGQQANGRGVHAVMTVDVLSYGVYKIEEAFKEDRFQPYVIVAVQMYRADNKKGIHSMFYMGTSPAPLPITKDFDAAIANSELLADYYNKAADNAVEMITTDLQPAW